MCASLLEPKSHGGNQEGIKLCSPDSPSPTEHKAAVASLVPFCRKIQLLGNPQPRCPESQRQRGRRHTPTAFKYKQKGHDRRVAYSGETPLNQPSYRKVATTRFVSTTIMPTPPQRPPPPSPPPFPPHCFFPVPCGEPKPDPRRPRRAVAFLPARLPPLQRRKVPLALQRGRAPGPRWGKWVCRLETNLQHVWVGRFQLNTGQIKLCSRLLSAPLLKV